MGKGASFRTRAELIEWDKIVHLGACYNKPELTPLFFPQRGQGYESRFALTLCNGDREHEPCPVRDECLAAHLYEYDGIWGGLSERERRRIRRHEQMSFRQRVRHNSARCPECWYAKCRCTPTERSA